MTLTTLVSGAQPAARETAIAGAIDRLLQTVVLLEGLPDGNTALASAPVSPHLHIIRIAPGCLCCTGNLVMRVTLNRILRTPPPRLFISLSASDHLPALRRFLQQAPYDQLLSITSDIRL